VTFSVIKNSKPQILYHESPLSPHRSASPAFFILQEGSRGDNTAHIHQAAGLRQNGHCQEQRFRDKPDQPAAGVRGQQTLYFRSRERMTNSLLFIGKVERPGY
jgi:hypothetical protein